MAPVNANPAAHALNQREQVVVDTIEETAEHTNRKTIAKKTSLAWKRGYIWSQTRTAPPASQQVWTNKNQVQRLKEGVLNRVCRRSFSIEDTILSKRYGGVTLFRTPGKTIHCCYSLFPRLFPRRFPDKNCNTTAIRNTKNQPNCV